MCVTVIPTMLKKPFFSILICTVGKEELTKGAISSILGQSNQNFEIIVTDTSGTKCIRQVVESFDDPRIRYFDVPDLDPTIAWDFAYTCSTGQYILWYDDDNRLIPSALERYAKLIKQEGADIVSGNHAYYFGEGNRHRPQDANTLNVTLPFSGKTTVYNPHTILRAIYDFSIGLPNMPARWHSAATFVARDICERAKKEIGYVIAPHMYGNFSFHPVIFSYAHTPVYDDRPLCIVGKFGSSITQQWSNSFVKASRGTAFPYRFTGVSQRTLGNTTAECYLQVRHDLPTHEKYPFNWEKFYRRYSGELLTLTTIPLNKHIAAWYELWRRVAYMEKKRRRSLRKLIAKQALQSIVLRLLRQLQIWEYMRARILAKVVREKRSRASISLNTYTIYTIDACAQNMQRILKDALSLDFDL